MKYKDGRTACRPRTLIFPNVELRLDVATAKGGFVNLHLLVSPEDTDHLAQLRRLLSRLHFTVQQDRFDCTRTELIRLGEKVAPTIMDERAALAYGANQYKVNFRELREVFAESEVGAGQHSGCRRGRHYRWHVWRQGGRRPDPCGEEIERLRGCDLREQSRRSASSGSESGFGPQNKSAPDMAA